MIDRPSLRAVTSSASRRRSKWNVSTLGESLRARAISPAGIPSGPASTREAEDVETTILGKRDQRRDSIDFFHISTNIESSWGVKDHFNES
jgi:hypothetical protein